MTILHIDSSITGENSVSRVLTRRIVEQVRAASPDAPLVRRDLTAEPLPHLTLDQLGPNPVLDEFLAADTVVIGAPMYNFTVPTQLKAWLDRIVIALSRGGFYGAEQGNADFEHLESYLRIIFAFIGITPEFVRADGITLGPDVKAKSVESALSEVEKLAPLPL